MAKTVTNPIVTCDDCKEKFKLKLKNIHRKEITEEINCTYFKCSHCGRKYMIAYEDNEFRDNIKKMDVLNKKMSLLTLSDEEYASVLDQHKKLHERNIEISRSYKKVYGN